MKQKLLLLLFSFAGILQLLTAQSNSEKYKSDFLKSKFTSRTEEKQKFITNDFSKLWTTTENSDVLGFIGTNYQRFYIKFLTVKKDPANPDTYLVTGKDKVKTNICDFTGTIKILNIRRNSAMDETFDNTIKNYCILASYSFKENPKQQFVGTFEGIVQSNFYLDTKGKIHFHSASTLSIDEFGNNGFMGTWKSYDGKYNKPCNWGDYHMPDNRGELDSGDGEFYPNEKYINNGWQNYVLGMQGDSPKSRQARAMEKMQWWK